ncbi:MAG: metallophosphoesterase [Halobacteriales archaeon]
MLVALGDTHRSDGHGLRGRTLEAVRAADAVAHTGDFTTVAALEAFEGEAAELHAVAGNNDVPAVAARLPDRTTFGAAGLLVAMVHGHAHSAEARSLLGRELGADLVVSGHSHRPGVEQAAGVTLLNPGSHAEPRWYRPAHAELVREDSGTTGRLVRPDGTVLETFRVGP